jgi:hypothetical protein
MKNNILLFNEILINYINFIWYEIYYFYPIDEITDIKIYAILFLDFAFSVNLCIF